MKWRGLSIAGVLLLLIVAGVAARFRQRHAAPATQLQPQPVTTAALPTPSASVQVRRSTGRIRLLEVGEGFHGDEVKARSGEKWWGLFVTESGAELEETTIKIRFVHDVVVDEDETQATGKSVSIDQLREPLFLVRNLPDLKPGPVTTVFHRTSPENFSLSKNSAVSFTLGAQTYQLTLTGRPAGPDAILPRDPHFWLTDGVTKQLLYSVKDEISDTDWALLWAGDLDGDGKLDLYAELNPHYNAIAHKLFLSSYAKPGQLVAEVAEFVITGC